MDVEGRGGGALIRYYHKKMNKFLQDWVQTLQEEGNGPKVYEGAGILQSYSP